MATSANDVPDAGFPGNHNELKALGVRVVAAGIEKNYKIVN
jgi:hypothetical protein